MTTGKVVHLLPTSAAALKERVCVRVCVRERTCAGLRPSERVRAKYARGNAAGRLPAAAV